MGYVKTLMMNDRSERMIPMVITLSSYVVFYLLIKRFSMVQGMGVVFLYFMSAFVSVSIALLITRFWKISLHAIGVGGLAAFTTIQLLVFDSISIPVSVLIFIIAGLTGTSRIYLNAHTPLQVWIGYLVGILPQAALLLWMI
jgi:membrane-associated phospholipid phosphatase